MIGDPRMLLVDNLCNSKPAHALSRIELDQTIDYYWLRFFSSIFFTTKQK